MGRCIGEASRRLLFPIMMQGCTGLRRERSEKRRRQPRAGLCYSPPVNDFLVGPEAVQLPRRPRRPGHTGSRWLYLCTLDRNWSKTIYLRLRIV